MHVADWMLSADKAQTDYRNIILAIRSYKFIINNLVGGSVFVNVLITKATH